MNYQKLLKWRYKGILNVQMASLKLVLGNLFIQTVVFTVKITETVSPFRHLLTMKTQKRFVT